MSDVFKLPDIGEGLAEGEIVKWLVAVGDAVVEDQPLVEVMTDKATVEIPSPRAGTVAELSAAEGDIVEIGTTILVFGDAATGADVSVPAETGAGSEEGAGAEADEAPDADEAAEADEAPDADEAAEADEAPDADEATEADEAPDADEATEGDEAPDVDEALDVASAVTADEIEEAREVARAERDAAIATATERKPWEAPAVAGGAIAPAARRLAGELGVDVSELVGSGPGGVVTKDDVRAFCSVEPVAGAEPTVEVEAPPEPAVEPEALPEPAVEPEVPLEPAVEAEAPPDPAVEVPALVQAEAVAPAAVTVENEERIPLRGLRRTIAERMLHATTTVPHYTYVEEVDMTEVVALREQAKPKAAERGVKLTYLPFIIRALVLALEDHPFVNAMLDEDAGEIVLKRYYNIGIATNTDRGLMVPVVKAAQDRDLLDLAAEITRLSTEAREGRIKLEDLQGGTFTISSTGNIGGLLATPVINVPEVAILGVTAIRERPVVRHGEIVIRHMLNLSLSCDHRVVDGAIGALFIRDLVRLLEDPKLQLLASL